MKVRKRSRSTSPEPSAAPAAPSARAEPRLVYTQAPVLLARVVDEVEGGFRVELGTITKVMPIDASVDPALIREACASGARVLVDQTASPVIVGVVATRRSLSIERDGSVAARVERFEVDAKREIVLKTPGAFVRAMPHEVELYGERVVTRARNLVKLLAAMIKIN
jgi:hypothetical protein